MSGNPNPTVCGNCQTENEPGTDVCTTCGQPLTRSAEEAIIVHQEAEAHGGLLGETAPPQPGVATTYVPNAGTPVKDGLPAD